MLCYAAHPPFCYRSLNKQSRVLLTAWNSGPDLYCRTLMSLYSPLPNLPGPWESDSSCKTLSSCVLYQQNTLNYK